MSSVKVLGSAKAGESDLMVFLKRAIALNSKDQTAEAVTENEWNDTQNPDHRGVDPWQMRVEIVSVAQNHKNKVLKLTLRDVTESTKVDIP